MQNKFKSLERIFIDTAIHFQIGIDGDVMVNATEMAKAFNKRTDHYLKTQETKKMIEGLERYFDQTVGENEVILPPNGGTLDAKTPHNEVILPPFGGTLATKTPQNEVNLPTIRGRIIDNRGRNGIYFHRLLALEFATWLDVDFKIWLFATVEKLMFNEYSNRMTNVILETDKTLESIEWLKYKINNNDYSHNDVLEYLNLQNRLKALKSERLKIAQNHKKAIQYTFNYEE